MAAVTQLQGAKSPGRAYYQRKRTEGKTGKQALRSLKRPISDVIYARLVADAKAAGTWNRGPGRQPGNVSKSSATGSHPAKPALRKSHSRTRPNTTTRRPARTRKTLPRAS
jgi:transposase